MAGKGLCPSSHGHFDFLSQGPNSQNPKEGGCKIGALSTIHSPPCCFACNALPFKTQSIPGKGSLEFWWTVPQTQIFFAQFWVDPQSARFGLRLWICQTEAQLLQRLLWSVVRPHLKAGKSKFASLHGRDSEVDEIVKGKVSGFLWALLCLIQDQIGNAPPLVSNSTFRKGRF